MSLFYSEISRFNCIVMTVMPVCHLWTEEGRTNGQPRRTIERQDWRFRKLALRDRFAAMRQIAEQ